MSDKEAPRIGKTAQRTHRARAALPRVDHRLCVRLDQRYGSHDGVDLFVLTLKVRLHCRVARIDTLLELREATIPRAQTFLDARRRRYVVYHSSSESEAAAEWRPDSSLSE
ncbi:hypothetical protein KDW20_33655 [Burkholderia cenocepacia]|nr:hypothetical protein [Burkholderia cenocepacia]